MKTREILLICTALALCGAALLIRPHELLTERLAKNLRKNDSLQEVRSVLIEAANRGELGSLLPNHQIKGAISKLVPWEYPHVLVESNQNVIGVFVFIGSSAPTGFCVFEGDSKQLELGIVRQAVSSNVFVFEALAAY